MDIDTTRRALVGAVLGAGVVGGAFPPASDFLDRFAPFTGSAWRGATDSRKRTVRSPYGEATVRYDGYGVPNVSAPGDEALSFAVGYAQAADRLFQMDLQRRQMRGRLSEVVGEATLDSDEFHVRMDFAGAADANWDLIGDTDTGAAVTAYADGVNACIEDVNLPMEFSLLGYEPEPWTPADSMLMEKQISWNLTGSFQTLRRAVVADRLGEEAAADLYPARLDHDSPIIREKGRGGTGTADRKRPSPGRDGTAGAVDADLIDWLGRFESPPGIGSNSWVVSGEHTDSGAPIVANDPHLTLMAPPVWYEMDLRTDETSVRGVTFPGVPFVVIGENHAGAWGFTNVGADVIDFYTYEIEGERYRYGGEWREFETEEREIEVAGAENRTVAVRKTVHGPMIERNGRRVGVAWTGHTATETTVAIHRYARAEGMDDVLAATELFDLPTQNLVYADRDGNTLYYVTGKLPIRTTDGEVVRGDRIFDGSAGEGEWAGFEPFGISSWEGFVPFDEKPHAVNPGYLATANQRVVDDPAHYLSEGYASPFRGRRIYELLDARVESGEPIDVDFVKRMHRDTFDGRAELLAPDLVAAARDAGGLDGVAETLDGWDGHMDRDSRAALVFARWFDHYRRDLFADEFERAGLDDSYYPSDWVIATLDAGSRWFGERSRADVMVDALRSTMDGIERDGHETYGDYNTTAPITHPFDLDFLNYPALPTDGSRQTVNNYAVSRPTGSSWRMICAMDGPSLGVIPGGNAGEYFSEHYHDQLRMWADVRYKSMAGTAAGEPVFRFEAGEDR